MRKMFPGWLLELGCAVGALFAVNGLEASAQTHGPALVANHRQNQNLIATEPAPRRIAPILGGKPTLPVIFEPSADGAPAGAQFESRTRGLNVVLTSQGISVVPPTHLTTATSAKLDIRLRGLQGFAWQGARKTPGETNYFLGNDPKKWRRHVPHFSRVETAPIRGISLATYGGPSGPNDVEYDIRADAGVSIAHLRLEARGAESIALDRAGDLTIVVAGNSVRMKAPAIYQEAGGRRQAIAGGYRLEAGSVGFWLGEHDPRAALVIDPSLSLIYETFLGGAGTDSAVSMASDAAGNLYLGGTTTSVGTFSENASGVFGNAPGSTQLFIAKIAPAVGGPGVVQYLDFFGGSAAQAGGQVAVDSNGNAAIMGTTTSLDYPVTDGTLPSQALATGTGNDLIVSEVDPTGTSLIFSTLFGGSGSEMLQGASGVPLTTSQNIPAGQGGIAFDDAGNIYVASDTTSHDLPTTGGSLLPVFSSQSADGFLVAFQPTTATGTSDLLYCTYLGVGNSAAVGGIAVDHAFPPNAYIAGYTSANSFLPKNAFQPNFAGGTTDGFLMKISPQGGGANDLLYATLLGGGDTDQALAVAVDAATPANAYVVGATRSQTFAVAPTVVGPANKLHAPFSSGAPSPQNAFLAVVGVNLATGMSSLQYFTYLGGSGIDAAQAVRVSSPAAVYLVGTTTSFDFPWRDNLQPFNGATDAFAARLDTTRAGSASLLYATPLGGTAPSATNSGGTTGNAIATDGAGHVYIAGQTASQDFPAVATSGAQALNGFQQTCASCPGKSDAFLVGMQESIAGQQPALAFSVAKIGVPAVAVGNGPGTPQPFAIFNTGDAPLHISGASPPVGPNGHDFSLDLSGCLQTIAPGASCVAEVNFTASAAGTEAGFMGVLDDAPGSPQLLGITGTGIGPLSVTPTSLAFQPAPVALSSPQQISVTFTAGGSPISNLAIVENGVDVAQFRPVSTAPAWTCTAVLAAGQSCQFTYQFAPQLAGTFQSEIDVSYQVNGVAGPAQILPMTGTGIPAAPLAMIFPTQLSFATASVGSVSALQGISVQNHGSASLVFSRVAALSGTNAADFSESDNCPSSIAPGGTCTVSIQFAPRTAGSKSAVVTLTDNAAGSPQIVALSGTAIAPPSISVAPSGLNFSGQIGATSAAQTVTLTNPGSSPLTFSSPIALSGTDATDFSQTNTCGQTLAAAGQCTVSVAFAPSCRSAGTRSAVLTISDNASVPTQTVALSGTTTGDFCLVLPPGGLTTSVTAGTTATFPSISIMPIGQVSATVNVACTVLPAGPGCTISPASSIALVPNVPAQVVIQAATTRSETPALGSPSFSLRYSPRRLLPALVVLALLLILCAAARTQTAQRLARVVSAAAVFALLGFSLSACGGGGAGVTDPPAAVASPQPIAAGSYTLSVTLADGAQTASLKLQLNVKSQ